MIGWKNGSNFCQSRTPRRHQRFVSEAIHQQAGCDERGRFFSSKMHRWKMITSYDAVADAGFPDDRDTRFRQSCDVPINRPDTSSKLISKILGPGHPAPLEIDQNRDKSVDG